MFDQQKYKNDYNKEKYATLKLTIPKEKKPILTDLAKIHNKSMNRIIIDALEKTYNIDLTIVESQLK